MIQQLGGSQDGGYLNPIDSRPLFSSELYSAAELTTVRTDPTYEYFPSRGADRNLTFLQNTYPLNLYPLTWLLPDGRLFMQGEPSMTGALG
jgi:hypothetical protein